MKYKMHFFLLLSLIASCIPKGFIQVNVHDKPNRKSPLNANVSTIQILNHQVILTGSNLNSVDTFKIQEGTNTFDLQIESKNNNSIVANTISNVTFSAGKIFNYILSNASAASTFTVDFSLCDSKLGGKSINCIVVPNDKDILSFDAGTDHWIPSTLILPAANTGTVATPGLSFIGNTNTGFYRPLINEIGITNGGVESVRINSAGNVGIGTTNPTSLFEVGSTEPFTISSTGAITGGSTVTSTLGGVSFSGYGTLYVPNGINIGGASSDIVSLAPSNDTAASGVSGGVRVTDQFIPTSGSAIHNAFAINTIINQTGGANGVSRGLYINPTITSASDFRALETTVGDVIFGSTSGKVGIGVLSPSEKLHILGNLRVQGSITDCILGNGSGGTNCSSDIRLKKNIREIKNPLNKILTLRGVEFDWNEKSTSDGLHAIGVIAQDIEKTFPTAVIQDPSTGYKKVDYAVLVAPVIQAFKEIYFFITELSKSSVNINKEITLLKLENVRLEKKLEEEIFLLKKENELLKSKFEQFNKSGRF